MHSSGHRHLNTHINGILVEPNLVFMEQTGLSNCMVSTNRVNANTYRNKIISSVDVWNMAASTHQHSMVWIFFQNILLEVRFESFWNVGHYGLHVFHFHLSEVE